MKVSHIALVMTAALVLGLVACGGDPPAGPSDPDPTAPSAPSNVTVVPGPGTVTVSWEHDGVDVTGFDVHRQVAAVHTAGTAPSWTVVGSVGATERTFVDDTVDEDVAYRYGVSARGGEDVASDPAEHAGDPVVPDPIESEPTGSLEFELVWETFAARGDVRSVAFDPSGTRVATGVLDSRAYVWDVEHDEPVLVLNAGSTVPAVAFTPDGAVLATSGSRLTLWDASDGVELRRISMPSEPDGPREWVNDLAFSPDGTSVAAASDSGYLRVFDVDTGALLLTIDVSAGVDASAAASALAATTDTHDRDVVFDDSGGVGHDGVASASRTVVLSSTGTRVRSVRFAPDGETLLSGSADGGVRVWNASTGALVRSLDGFTANVTAVRYSPDGSLIAAAGAGGATPLLVWSAGTGAVTRSIDALDGGAVQSIDFAPGGVTLAGVGAAGRAFVWDVVDDAIDLTWAAHATSSSGVAFDSSGTRIATAGGRKDGKAIVWDATDGSEVVAWQHEGRVTDVAFSPDGSSVVASADDGAISAWAAATGAARFVNDDLFDARRITYSPSGDRLAVAEYSNIHVLDSDTGASVVRFPTPDWSFSLAFDASGDRIASGSWDRSAHVWNAATGASLTTIPDAHTRGQLETIAFTPDGESLVTGVGYLSGSAEFAVWNSATGTLVQRRDANTHGVFAAAFADDGALMLTGGRDSIMLWDTETWEHVGTLPVDGTAAALVVDDGLVVVGGWDLTSVVFLDLASGDVLGSVPAAAWHIDFDAASGRLVAAVEGTIQVWQVSTVP